MKAHIEWEPKDVHEGLNGRVYKGDGFDEFRVLLEADLLEVNYFLVWDDTIEPLDTASSDREIASILNDIGAVPYYVESTAELKPYEQKLKDINHA